MIGTVRIDKVKALEMQKVRDSQRVPEGVLKSPAVNSEPAYRRVLVGTPTLGVVRIEWHNAMGSIVIPCNWSNSANTPIGYLVHDAQNILVHEALRSDFEWLLLIEDDVVVPPNIFLTFGLHMEQKTAPIVSGLYHLKGTRAVPEPLVYRGRGTGAFKGFTAGETIWADGVPTGCLLIHTSILKVLAATAPVYTVRNHGVEMALKRVFHTPREAMLDSGTGAYQKLVGTSDLHFCDQIIREGVLKQAGWPEHARRKYPFLVDTSIRCGHIDRATGVMF
jgi:hypothetical protein